MWEYRLGLAVTYLSWLAQGLHYHYFELGKNADPERETNLRFQSAFTVHPVLDPLQMYRLHKYFAQVELERTYQEIQQLQVRPGLSGRVLVLFVIPVWFLVSLGFSPDPAVGQDQLSSCGYRGSGAVSGKQLWT